MADKLTGNDVMRGLLSDFQSKFKSEEDKQKARDQKNAEQVATFENIAKLRNKSDQAKKNIGKAQTARAAARKPKHRTAGSSKSRKNKGDNFEGGTEE